MDKLERILESIPDCRACSLMEENGRLDIPYIPILSKPRARFMFVGRDPSPRTAAFVGVRDRRSAFIRDVFRLADEAGLPEDMVYITDMVKCHWRTSRGTPWPGTEPRPAAVPAAIAQACIRRWLWQEMEALQPIAMLTFGAELYEQIREYVVSPLPAPEKLSASRDKSLLDAELHFAEHGPFTVRLGSVTTALLPMRHAGSSSTLREDAADRRWLVYRQGRDRAVDVLRSAAGAGAGW